MTETGVIATHLAKARWLLLPRSKNIVGFVFVYCGIGKKNNVLNMYMYTQTHTDIFSMFYIYG